MSVARVIDYAVRMALVACVLPAVLSFGCASPVGGGDGNDNNANDNNSNGDDNNGNDNGGSGGDWTEVVQLLADDAEQGDRFGNAVAIGGDTIVVGASSKDQNQGAAYAFRDVAGAWHLEGQFLGLELFNPQAFGQSVAIVGDTAFVAASNYAPADSFFFQIGGIYIFQRDASGWQAGPLLTVAEPESQDYLGYSMAATEDVLVAGAFGRDDLRGVAYTFRRNGNEWAEEQMLEADDGINFDWFGESVAIDGDTIVVGAPVQNFGTGTVYVFEYDGDAWVQTDKLFAPMTHQTDQFGFAVAIEGDTLVASAALRDGDGVLDAGEAYVFTRSGSGWTYQQTLTAEDATIGRHFGTSIDINGNTIAIGAPVVSQVYVFDNNGSTWQRVDQLLPGPSRPLYDLFGTWVALQGNTIVGGAMTSAEAGPGESGAAYIFQR